MTKEIVIEIPKGSNIKYEIENGKLYLDRILFGSNVYPHNYGYFENTLDFDGDPLDALLIADQPILPGCIVKARILGSVKMIDGGETDTKILAVIDKDHRYSNIKSMDDVPKEILDEIKDFFENYKNLQNKEVKINGFGDLKHAEEQLKECSELFKKYNHLSKDDFIKKMKTEHPDKYE